LRTALEYSSVTKYALVDAEMLSELLKTAPKEMKAKVAAVKNSAKEVNPKAVELLGLLNDFMERTNEVD